MSTSRTARKWIGFFAAWILVALPQLLLQQGGAPGALASLRFQFRSSFDAVIAIGGYELFAVTR